MLPYYRSKPESLVCYLLQHPGPGTLLDALRERKWAYSIKMTSELWYPNSYFTIIAAGINLTDEGLNHIPEIIELVYHYVEVLKNVPDYESIAQDLMEMTQREFNYMLDSLDNYDDMEAFVEDLSVKMQIYPEEHWLSEPHLIYEYDFKVISTCLDSLKPSNMNIVLFTDSPEPVNELLVEEWSGMKYTKTEVPARWMDMWTAASESRSSLRLPQRNSFLGARTLQVACVTPSQSPVLLQRSFHGELYYKFDASFKSIATYAGAFFRSLPENQTLFNGVCNEVLLQTALIHLSTVIYDADCLGYINQFRFLKGGLFASVQVPDEHLLAYFDKFLSALFRPDFSETHLSLAKEYVTKKWTGDLLKPKNLASSLRDSILTQHSFGIPALHLIQEVTMQNLISQAGVWRNSFFVSCLLQGNQSDKIAGDLLNLCCSYRIGDESSIDKVMSPTLYQIPVGNYVLLHPHLNEEDTISVVYNMMSAESYNVESNTMLHLIAYILYQPFFDQLRTKETLGYDVNVSFVLSESSARLELFIEYDSLRFSHKYIDSRIDAFVLSFLDDLVSMDTEEYQDHVDSFVSSLLDPPTSLLLSCTENHQCIVKQLPFDHLQIEASTARRVSQSTLTRFYREELIERRRKLSIRILGSNEVERAGGAAKGITQKLRCCQLPDLILFDTAIEDHVTITDITKLKAALDDTPVKDMVQRMN